MKSTLVGRVPEYLGVDLSDRYSRGCRNVDVCGLTIGRDGTLVASFWFWRWDNGPDRLEGTAIIAELKAARCAMVDGPHALAQVGRSIRMCEQQAAAVGKTGDCRPLLTKPFGGFICSSLDLFAALQAGGVAITPPGFLGGVCEVYPGHIWQILCGRHALSKKSTDEGRLVRRNILAALGVVGLPELPTHDQNDACVAALLGAAADRRVPGLTVTGIGSPLYEDPDGILREGLMVIPEVNEVVTQRMAKILEGADVRLVTGDAQRRTSRSMVPADVGTSLERANQLLGKFIEDALTGRPRMCTYAWAFQKLFDERYERWSQAYAQRVVAVAQQTDRRELAGLGRVGLDSFVVSKKSRMPSDGHWAEADYDREDWERVLGAAEVAG